MGKVSKAILEKVNIILEDSLRVYQWKDTDVINWFNAIKNKSQCFIQLDIAEFYPSITGSILDTAISFARQHRYIKQKIENN